MKKLKHTPGPWIKSGTLIELTECLTYGALTTDGNHLSELRSNARIIASAPEMLEALILEYKFAQIPPIEISKMKRLKLIIEKATGLKIEDIIND